MAWRFSTAAAVIGLWATGCGSDGSTTTIIERETKTQTVSSPQAPLPNGRPGYALPEEKRSLDCVGIDAETGECVGD